MVEKAGKSENALIVDELRTIRKLLVTSLLLSGVDANLLATILGYKSKSSITNSFPVERIQDCDGKRLDLFVAKLSGVRRMEEHARKEKSTSK